MNSKLGLFYQSHRACQIRGSNGCGIWDDGWKGKDKKKTLNVQYARNRCILKMIPKGTCIDIWPMLLAHTTYSINHLSSLIWIMDWLPCAIHTLWHPMVASRFGPWFFFLEIFLAENCDGVNLRHSGGGCGSNRFWERQSSWTINIPAHLNYAKNARLWSFFIRAILKDPRLQQAVFRDEVISPPGMKSGLAHHFLVKLQQ